MIHKAQDGTRLLTIANIGDTNAVIRHGDGKAEQLTVEHNAAVNQQEVKRIQDAGAFVVMGKVAGVLSVTRAFGDLDLKTYVLKKNFFSSSPYRFISCLICS